MLRTAASCVALRLQLLSSSQNSLLICCHSPLLKSPIALLDMHSFCMNQLPIDHSVSLILVSPLRTLIPSCSCQIITFIVITTTTPSFLPRDAATLARS